MRCFDADRDRKLFKELFWLRRNPNLLNPKNEFREEFERRRSIANRNFRERGRLGSTTDMGKVLLLLGNPDRTDETYREAAGSVRLALPGLADVASPSPQSEGSRTSTWVYSPDSQLGIPEGLKVEFQTQTGSGSWWSDPEKVEEALERVKNIYISNQDINYSPLVAGPFPARQP